MDKRDRAHGIMEDRISDLPRNLIDCILKRMTTRDAARTSILSKKWRYIWASHPQLVLDRKFFKGIIEKKQYHKFVSIIKNILLLHSGPILKFSLHIPDIDFNQIPDIDLWILVLSRNGIKKLIIDNSNLDPYKLPSCIFSCLQLTHLKLSNCILKPPLAFGGFPKLSNLHLEKMSFPANFLGTLLPSAPMLKALAFANCTGIGHLKFHAPKLDCFAVEDGHDFEWLFFESNRNLRNVCIFLGKEVENSQKGKTTNLMKLLGNLQRIVLLLLDGFSLKFLAAGTVPKQLPSTIQHLKHLGLFDIGFNDFDQISCVLCLLRSSPNLKRIKIEASTVTSDVMEPVINYLNAPNCMGTTLENLETVEFKFMRGSRAELLFVKLLLACSPSLERVIIELHSEIDDKEDCRITRELLGFYRASAIAKMFYLKPVDIESDSE